MAQILTLFFITSNRFTLALSNGTLTRISLLHAMARYFAQALPMQLTATSIRKTIRANQLARIMMTAATVDIREGLMLESGPQQKSVVARMPLPLEPLMNLQTKYSALGPA